MAQQHSSEEIDLGYLLKKISNFFVGIIKMIFSILAFFRKYLIITLILIIGGVVIGYFLDRSEPVYKNELIVIPNFESSDFLYQEVEALNLKKQAGDSLFFKSILGDRYEDFIQIKIEPIVDIYTFIADKKENLETLRILYDNKDPEEFLSNNIMNKYYKYQKIIITCKGESSQKISENILGYFNSNEHFKAYRQVGLINTQIQIAQNEAMIEQIDSVMKNFSNKTDQKNTQSVYINNQSDLYQMINTKQALLNNRLKLQKDYIDEQQIVKLVNGSYNLPNEGIFSVSNKIKIPLLFLILFAGVFLALRFIAYARSISENH